MNNTAYLLFQEIEDNIRDTPTPEILCTTREKSKRSTISDENILFYWTLLSVDIDNEQDSMFLLREIIQLWLTVRGHSIPGQWLEIYKNSKSKTTKSSKSLRKTLKQGDTCSK